MFMIAAICARFISPQMRSTTSSRYAGGSFASAASAARPSISASARFSKHSRPACADVCSLRRRRDSARAPKYSMRNVREARGWDVLQPFGRPVAVAVQGLAVEEDRLVFLEILDMRQRVVAGEDEARPAAGRDATDGLGEIERGGADA